MHAPPRSCLCLVFLLALASCSRTAPDPAAPDQQACTRTPDTKERDKRPRCGATGVANPPPRAYRVVGGSGDPVDQTVCDIHQAFVLNGRLFGVAFSGGVDGTYTFVRTPDIPGLHWNAGGRYHIEFPDGTDKPGTMTTEGGGTTTAGSQSRTTAGSEHFSLTPTGRCGGAA